MPAVGRRSRAWLENWTLLVAGCNTGSCVFTAASAHQSASSVPPGRGGGVVTWAARSSSSWNRRSNCAGRMDIY